MAERRPHQGDGHTRIALFGRSVDTDHRFENRMAPTDRPADLTFTVGPAPWPVPPTDETADYASSHVLPSGQALASVHLLPEGTLFRWGEVVDFHLEPHAITAHVLDPAYGYMTEIRLLGPVFACVLEQTGRLALHGSAVSLDGRAIGFLSENHGGKTSMAAMLLRRGAGLVTDDLLAVEVGAAGARATPAYPQMRMWPKEAEHFWGSVDELELVHPHLDKRRVPVGNGDGLGWFCTDEPPLDRIYILERITGGAGFHVETRRLPQAEALVDLMRHSFLVRIPAALGWQPRRLAQLAELVAAVPVTRVRFTAEPGDMARLWDAIASD